MQLPEAFQASDGVKRGDLEFQVVSAAVWPAPEAGGISPIPLQLRVSNRGKEKAEFIPIVGMPILKTADGMPLKAQCHGNDHIRVLPKPVTLEPAPTDADVMPCTFATERSMGKETAPPVTPRAEVLTVLVDVASTLTTDVPSLTTVRPSSEMPLNDPRSTFHARIASLPIVSASLFMMQPPVNTSAVRASTYVPVTVP